jgi:hypothetical protein
VFTENEENMDKFKLISCKRKFGKRLNLIIFFWKVFILRRTQNLAWSFFLNKNSLFLFVLTIFIEMQHFSFSSLTKNMDTNPKFVVQT